MSTLAFIGALTAIFAATIAVAQNDDVRFDTFPGDERMADEAFTQCLDRFAGFVGTDYELSSLDVTALYPSSQSWSLQDDREVVCAVYDMNGGKLTGSAKDSAI